MAGEPAPRAPSRRQAAVELLAVWSLLAVFATASTWSSVQARNLRDPDDAARLVQVRELLGGQSWWDLTLTRIGAGGAEMHWSRHVDGLLVAVIAPLRSVVGAEAAETVAIIAVPLLLLLAALAIISSLARLLAPRPDSGLYAMVAFGMGAVALNRLGPGALDHHGLQIVLALLMVRMALAAPSRRSGLIAGAAGGVSLTVGLETLPVVATVLAAVGATWAVGVGRNRVAYPWFGTALVASAVTSSYLFGPTDRLLGTACDVLSVGVLGLIVAPSLGLAALGGRPWRLRSRWIALVAMGLAGFAWFATVSPSCARGPYASLPDEVFRVWLDLIAETQGILDLLAIRPFAGLTLATGPVVAAAHLAWKVWRTKATPFLILLAPLLVAMVLSAWQLRMIQMAIALSAPVLGGIIVDARGRIGWTILRPLLAVALVLTLSGFAFAIAGTAIDEPQEDFDEAAAACVPAPLLVDLGALPPGLIAMEMDFGPAVLLHTDHRILASPYHRAYEGVLATYDLFAGAPEDGASPAHSVGLSYIMVCDDTALSRIWSADHPDGLLAALLADEPPPWLSKVIETGRSRIYAVSNGPGS